MVEDSGAAPRAQGKDRGWGGGGVSGGGVDSEGVVEERRAGPGGSEVVVLTRID